MSRPNPSSRNFNERVRPPVPPTQSSVSETWDPSRTPPLSRASHVAVATIGAATMAKTREPKRAPVAAQSTAAAKNVPTSANITAFGSDGLSLIQRCDRGAVERAERPLSNFGNAGACTTLQCDTTDECFRRSDATRASCDMSITPIMPDLTRADHSVRKRALTPGISGRPEPTAPSCPIGVP